MRKLLLLILITLPFLCGCKSVKGDSVFPRDYAVTINRIQAQRVWIEVFPSSEQTKYLMTLMPVADYEKYYGGADGDKRFVQEMDSMAHTQGEWSGMIQQGAMFGACVTHPATDYYLMLVGYSNNKPVLPIRKEPFTTLERVTSDIHIADLKMDDTDLILTPSNNEDTYIWELGLMSDIRLTAGCTSFYFYDLLEEFYYYDFTKEMVDRGPELVATKDIFELPDVQNDTLVIMFVGYDGLRGETTDAYEVWWAIPQPGGDQLIRKADPDGFESIFMPVQVPAYSIYHDPHRRHTTSH